METGANEIAGLAKLTQLSLIQVSNEPTAEYLREALQTSLPDCRIECKSCP
jgi:hypothetical protein